ncbi:MAG: ChaN family lipoprotein [Myxococcales bacterium]|nr:ChaN family lipoprotein [Myxococcales bacterium]
MTSAKQDGPKRFRRPRAPLAWTLAAMATLGCASSTPLSPAYSPLSHNRVIVDFTTGAVTDAEAVVRDLASVSQVYVGEVHTSAFHHEVQVEVASRLHAVRPIVIGVEWLPAAADAVLAEWSAGRLDEDALLARLGWRQVWGHDFAHYREIFRWVRSEGVTMVGLNPPPGLAEAVGRHGVSGVPPALRELLPPLDSGNDPHRLYFRDQMLRHAHAHGHGFNMATLERYYQAQLVRDETMARRVGALLDEEPDRLVLVCAGLGHIDRGHGVPLRVSRSRPSESRDFRIVMPVKSGDMETLAVDFGPADFPARRADWAWEARPTGGALALGRQTRLRDRPILLGSASADWR